MPFKVREGLIVTVGTTSDTLFAANPGRLFLSITNTHASQILYVRIGTSPAVATAGFPIAAGATKEWGLNLDSAVPGEAIYVIGNGSATTLFAFEGNGRLMG